MRALALLAFNLAGVGAFAPAGRASARARARAASPSSSPESLGNLIADTFDTAANEMGVTSGASAWLGETKAAESILDFETYASGLKVKDTVVGGGAAPRDGDELEVHYAGWYFAAGSEQGVKFDDSRARDAERGLVFEYGLAPIIAGWQEGLATMREGGVRTIIVPPRLGYGSTEVKAAGLPPIPADSELHFVLELVAVDNSPVRKFRRGVGNFLRPQGAPSMFMPGTRLGGAGT